MEASGMFRLANTIESPKRPESVGLDPWHTIIPIDLSFGSSSD